MSYSHKIDRKTRYSISDPISQIHDYNIDIQCNHLYLFAEEGISEEEGEPGVEYTMANRFIRNLNILMRKTEDPILIHMKTDGGDWQEGMAIYDAIRACPNPITILVYTYAVSMSSIILQAGNKRVMMPHSSFMFHYGSHAIGGSMQQVESDVAFYAKSKDIMLDIYTKRMKDKGKLKRRSKDFIRDWLIDKMHLHHDVWLSSHQAVAYGLADAVFGYDGKYDWSSLLKYSSDELTW